MYWLEISGTLYPGISFFATGRALFLNICFNVLYSIYFEVIENSNTLLIDTSDDFQIFFYSVIFLPQVQVLQNKGRSAVVEWRKISYTNQYEKRNTRYFRIYKF